MVSKTLISQGVCGQCGQSGHWSIVLRCVARRFPVNAKFKHALLLPKTRWRQAPAKAKSWRHHLTTNQPNIQHTVKHSHGHSLFESTARLHNRLMFNRHSVRFEFSPGCPANEPLRLVKVHLSNHCVNHSLSLPEGKGAQGPQVKGQYPPRVRRWLQGSPWPAQRCPRVRQA